MSLFCELCLHRYYLVEKAKDANIIGILVGTLGVGLLLFEILYLHFSVPCAFILIVACLFHVKGYFGLFVCIYCIALGLSSVL